MKENWIVRKENPKLRDRLAKGLDISPVTVQVLINRGISTEEEAELFLNSTLFDLPSPFLLKGMDKAVERVKKAIERSEKIAVYGDYDVDGITATALLHNFLDSVGASVIYYNPDRFEEGYGVNIEAVRKLHREGVSLIISGDCGISDWEEVEEAKSLGIDFIVADHHKLPDIVPDAVSILNPKQPGCSYPGKEITGVGVIFNLAIALRRALRDDGFFNGKEEPNLGDYLDLVALGTVADCASLTSVNRIFVREGLKRMECSKRIGVRALKEVSGVRGKVDSYDLGFRLGPRVNASGRLASAGRAVQLFISENPDEAMEIARELHRENSKRQSIEGEILAQALSEIESNPELADSNSFVLASRGWHQGVIGIVASKIVELYEKPTVLISIGEEGIGKGSGRSVDGINLYEALSECRELFLNFGGHELAAGISIREENIDRLREMLSKSIQESSKDFVSKLKIDCSLKLNQITDFLISEIELLSPFGVGNPKPVFVAESVEVVSQELYKEKHLGLKVRQESDIFGAIWFNLKEPREVPKSVDMVFSPEFNTWNGRTEIQLRIRDMDW